MPSTAFRRDPRGLICDATDAAAEVHQILPTFWSSFRVNPCSPWLNSYMTDLDKIASQELNEMTFSFVFSPWRLNWLNSIAFPLADRRGDSVVRRRHRGNCTLQSCKVPREQPYH
jgi:hypothetical protein